MKPIESKNENLEIIGYEARFYQVNDVTGKEYDFVVVESVLENGARALLDWPAPLMHRSLLETGVTWKQMALTGDEEMPDSFNQIQGRKFAFFPQGASVDFLDIRVGSNRKEVGQAIEVGVDGFTEEMKEIENSLDNLQVVGFTLPQIVNSSGANGQNFISGPVVYV